MIIWCFIKAHINIQNLTDPKSQDSCYVYMFTHLENFTQLHSGVTKFPRILIPTYSCGTDVICTVLYFPDFIPVVCCYSEKLYCAEKDDLGGPWAH